MQHGHARARSALRSRWTLVAGTALPVLLVLCSVSAQGPAYAGRPGAATVDQKVELGRRLFFDPAVSRSGHVSCGSCHDPDHGFSDPRTFSKDDDFALTRRHSSTLVDCAPSPAVHWDGEFPTVASLVFARLGSRQEFEREIRKPRKDLPKKQVQRRIRSKYGMRSRNSVAARVPVADAVARSGRYTSSALAAFGTKEISTAQIAEAIQAYVATIKSTPGPFDRYVAGDADAMSDAAVRGLHLFKGRAGCAQCHTMKGEHPAFTDYKFHDTGISFRAAKIAALADGKMTRRAELLLRMAQNGRRAPGLDGGRLEISGDGRDLARFKTPSLRDVALRPPYMHDGGFRSLEEVVRYYAEGATKEDANLDKHIRPFEASDRDVADLVAFLEALTGDVRPGRAPAAWRLRPQRMRIGFVDRAGRALAGVPVRLRGAGDELPGEGSPHAERSLVTDARGWIDSRTPLSTHVRIVLPGDLKLPGGNILPDTVRDVRFVVPVEGRARLSVRVGETMHVPRQIILRRAHGSATATLERSENGTAIYGVWMQGRSSCGHAELDGDTEFGRGGKVQIRLDPGRVSHVDLTN